LSCIKKSFLFVVACDSSKGDASGTGPGISLAYNITKAHGGELKVNTKEGEYAEFIVQLPVINN